MSAVYANQKILHITSSSNTDCLHINNDAWQEAARNLTPATFQLYLYLASHVSGTVLLLSFADVSRTIDISKSSYHRSIKELKEAGYLRQEQENIYAFAAEKTAKEGSI